MKQVVKLIHIIVMDCINKIPMRITPNRVSYLDVNLEQMFRRDQLLDLLGGHLVLCKEIF